MKPWIIPLLFALLFSYACQAAPEIVFGRNCEGRSFFGHSKLPAELQLGEAYTRGVPKKFAALAQPPLTPIATVFDGVLEVTGGDKQPIVVLLVHKFGGDGNSSAGPALFVSVFRQAKDQQSLTPIGEFGLGSLQRSRVFRGSATNNRVSFRIECVEGAASSSEMVFLSFDQEGKLSFRKSRTSRQSTTPRPAPLLIWVASPARLIRKRSGKSPMTPTLSFLLQFGLPMVPALLFIFVKRKIPSVGVRLAIGVVLAVAAGVFAFYLAKEHGWRPVAKSGKSVDLEPGTLFLINTISVLSVVLLLTFARKKTA
ncbi:MAG: hypothetical protein QM760_03640 [Nibricoccus sp.]